MAWRSWTMAATWTTWFMHRLPARESSAAFLSDRCTHPVTPPSVQVAQPDGHTFVVVPTGGAGGGGYYGSGGGATSAFTGDYCTVGSEGGGGSSYVVPKTNGASITQGTNDGDGYLTLTW